MLVKVDENENLVHSILAILNVEEKESGEPPSELEVMEANVAGFIYVYGLLFQC
jgi:hypothetical protein